MISDLDIQYTFVFGGRPIEDIDALLVDFGILSGSTVIAISSGRLL
jgi:hypothetical protein